MKMKIFLLIIYYIGGIVFNSHAQNDIIFWKYHESVSFNDLNELNFDSLPDCFEIYARIPLIYFTDYFWDEQILRMPRSVFDENSYINDFEKIFFESNKSSIFFSIIINNKIVLNGVNRIMPTGAGEDIYGEHIYPKILLSMHDDSAFIRFVMVESFFSIWESNIDNISKLFNEELYNYFFMQNKIITGRIDVPSVLYGIKILR